MSAKAVYNNKGLAIYITGEDFEQLLREWNIWSKLYIGKTETRKSFVSVILSDEAQAEIANAYKLESQAINEARRKHQSGFAKQARKIIEIGAREYAKRRFRHSADGADKVYPGVRGG